MNKELVDKLVAKCREDQIQKIVVGAVISRDSKVLLLERPLDDFMGGLCELPSGNVESGEDILSALEREIIEETGLKTEKVVEFLDSFDYKSGSGKSVRQLNFLVYTDNGAIKLTEHSNYFWSNLKDEPYKRTSNEVKATLDKYSGRLSQ